MLLRRLTRRGLSSLTAPLAVASGEATVAADLAAANAASRVLAAVSSEPEAVLQLLASAAPRLEATTSGRTLANLVATCALARHEHSAAAGDFSGASSRRFLAETESFLRRALEQRLLRRLVFDGADSALLYHAHLSILLAHASAIGGGASRAAPLPPCLPRDIADACLRSHNAHVSSQQALFDIVAMSLRRAGAPYTYRSSMTSSGYLVWLLLPSTPRPVRRAAARAPPLTSRASLEIALDWNTLENDEPTLAARLYALNLERADGVRLELISRAERAAFLEATGGLIDDDGGGSGGRRVPLCGSHTPGTGSRAAQTFASLPELLLHISRALKTPPGASEQSDRKPS